MCWGESHGVILDDKGRIFAMGLSSNGRLGLPDKELPEYVEQPTQVTFGLPYPTKQNKIIFMNSGNSHSIAVTKKGDLYSWGRGDTGALGLGYIEATQSTVDQETPYKIETVFDSKSVSSLACGKTMSGAVMQSGTVYSWGKGAYERVRGDDYKEYSSPYVILEQKHIVHTAIGTDHVLALDRFGQLYTWGEGAMGALGLGDGKKRFVPTLMVFFEDKRVIDVSCGD